MLLGEFVDVGWFVDVGVVVGCIDVIEWIDYFIVYGLVVDV